MISLKNASQIAKMREAGKILREVEDEVRLAVKPGVTTAELDVLAERLIRKHHAIPTSLHYEGYPCTICASVNDGCWMAGRRIRRLLSAWGKSPRKPKS